MINLVSKITKEDIGHNFYLQVYYFELIIFKTQHLWKTIKEPLAVETAIKIVTRRKGSKRDIKQNASSHDLSGDDKLQKQKNQKDRLSANAPERDPE
jgi:hypothetical protein